MRIAVTGVGSICAAGRGPDAVLRRHSAGENAFRVSSRYPTVGLTNAMAGFCDDLPATELLVLAVTDALAQSGLRQADLVVGTSSGDVPSGTRDGPALAAWARLGLGGRVVTLSVACASGTAALAVAAGWLEDGSEAVVAAGVDALTLFVHSGFSGLGALSADIPRPFHATRDGLALGEGAAALVLEPYARAEARGAPILAELAGVGLSCDAGHATAPHREGRGAAQAMRAALDEAGFDAVDLVSVHGTGTRYNDAMEARALQTVFGARDRHVYGLKGVIGHLLGAAGALECAVAVHALAHGIRPTPIRDVDPDLPWVPASSGGPPRTAMVTSSAFGGINAVAVFGRATRRPRIEPVIREGGEHAVTLDVGQRLAEAWPDAPARATRLDRYGQAGVWAIARALAAAGHLTGDVGVVLTTRLGCAEADLSHTGRLEAEGAGRISRLVFATTVPSAPAAAAAVLFDLRGPLLTFIGQNDPVEEARRLIRGGRAAALVAVWCDAPGPDRPATARARFIARA